MAGPAPAASLRVLRTLYFAMAGFQLLAVLGALALVRLQGAFLAGLPLPRALYIVVPVLLVAVVTLAVVGYARRVRRAQARHSLALKLQQLQMAFVLRLALLEGAAFFAAFVFALSGEYVFLVLYAMLLAIFLQKQPSAAMAIKDLALSPQEALTVLGTPEQG